MCLLKGKEHWMNEPLADQVDFEPRTGPVGCNAGLLSRYLTSVVQSPALILTQT